MKKSRLAFIIIVLAVCALPAVLMLCGVKNANRENRPLAQMPELSLGSVIDRSFARGFDKYVNDHFALREYFVTACNTVTAALTGDYNGQSALIGRQGRLYYSETADDYLGVNGLSAERIASAADYLLDLQQQLAAEGREFIFIIAPNKSTVYPEYAPSYLRPTDADRNIDLLQSALCERGVNYIDAAALLAEGKQVRSTYYLRDSHWNNYGATLVYNAAAERLGLEKYDAEAFTTVCDYSGDLVNFVYPSARHYEERLVYTYPREYQTVDHRVDFDMFKVNETASDANDMTLFVYHDSFGKSLQPIFSTAVGRLIMHKSNSPAYSIADIEDYGADAVIIELVERNLDLLCGYAEQNGF